MPPEKTDPKPDQAPPAPAAELPELSPRVKDEDADNPVQMFAARPFRYRCLERDEPCSSLAAGDEFTARLGDAYWLEHETPPYAHRDEATAATLADAYEANFVRKVQDAG